MKKCKPDSVRTKGVEFPYPTVTLDKATLKEWLKCKPGTAVRLKVSPILNLDPMGWYGGMDITISDYIKVLLV
jgi:hypothetical protein